MKISLIVNKDKARAVKVAEGAVELLSPLGAELISAASEKKASIGSISTRTAGDSPGMTTSIPTIFLPAGKWAAGKA